MNCGGGPIDIARLEKQFRAQSKISMPKPEEAQGGGAAAASDCVEGQKHAYQHAAIEFDLYLESKRIE